MAKKTLSDWKSWYSSLHKNNHFIIKLGVSVLLLGITFRVLYSRSWHFSTVSDSPFLESSQISPPLVQSLEISSENASQIHHQESTKSGEKCDLFSGDWIPYKEVPHYTNETCSFIEDHQNCLKNGRPDTDYLYWRWKPIDCDLPRVDPQKFLHSMRNKSWALIGDSITRNHVQSLLCILSTVEKPVEVYHDESYKSRRWIFPSYNLTISVIWSPLLSKAAIFEDTNGVSTSEIELHIDTLDSNWTDQFESFDYTIFSSGKWFDKSVIYYQNDTVIGCHKCPKRNLTELGLDFAYRRVVQNVMDYIIEKGRNGKIFYRTSTPDHFENGKWFNGGTCERKSPAREGEVELSEVSESIRVVELEEFETAEVRAYENGVDLRLFDVGPLSLLRPDGHPGPYRFFQPFAEGKDAKKVINDCLHWCLPGPIDYWSDILMVMVMNDGGEI